MALDSREVFDDFNDLNCIGCLESNLVTFDLENSEFCFKEVFELVRRRLAE